MKIADVDKNSPLFGHVKPGDKLLKINGEPVRDNVDCLFKLSEDVVRLVFLNTAGKRKTFEIENPGDLGLQFEPDKIKVCKNKCIFCFVHQQPKGMRRSLYIKDDDYRLSFTHGNFISFSNINDDDIRRIIDQRLSPLYISVHATDDDLRRELFANRKLPPILPRLEYLAKKGIAFHTQVVVCPGINDRKHLDKTVDDLFSLYPAVSTLGIVPVGLTKYRRNLPKLKSFTPMLSSEMVDYIEERQRTFLEKCGSRFVFAADEFYIMAGREFPKLSEYETMEQFENGIGMMRQFIADFNRKKRFLEKIDKIKRIIILTGESAYTSLKEYIMPQLKQSIEHIELIPVKNRFWGSMVTVSGLLTGRDLLRSIKKVSGGNDIAILPPNCLNNDNLFLDNMALDEFERKAGIRVVTGTYSMIDTLRKVLN